MRSLTGIIYDKKPKDVMVYLTSVYVIKSCKEIIIKDEEGNLKVKYKCDVEVYSTVEYIDYIQKENASLHEQVKSLQLLLNN